MRAGSVSKFIFAASAAFAAAVTFDFRLLVILLAALLTAFITWGGSSKDIMKVAKIALWFFLLVFILHLFAGSGRVLFEIWFLGATLDGALSGLFYGLKLFVFVYSAYIIFFKVDPVELINPIERSVKYFGPPGRHISSFMISFSLALRFLPDLARQARTNMMAFRSRGLDLKGGIGKKIRTANLLLVSIFVSTFKKAESVSVALEIKGYPLRYKQAVFRKAETSAFEIFVVTVSLIIVFAGWISR